MAGRFSFGLLMVGVFLLSSFSEGNKAKLLYDQGNVQKTWCVAKPSTDDETLRRNFNFSCSQSHVNCGVLSKGSACFYPDNLINHASVAMNLYYSSTGRNAWNCYFGGSALITTTDPSYAGCYYA
ncbi:glucan endo-1,3-beta-D-glucosidase-like [Nymphaea colorata]|uniref:glucan endo-1,3-beta-D-glucosidase-like n=1 Tax=Nymphaea colorata TaxID=210225 RepID=UPI00129D405D|nr:glucan endo-1,3-beta-D-glucosidase-like [Nymphaea colorata]